MSNGNRYICQSTARGWEGKTSNAMQVVQRCRTMRERDEKSLQWKREVRTSVGQPRRSKGLMKHWNSEAVTLPTKHNQEVVGRSVIGYHVGLYWFTGWVGVLGICKQAGLSYPATWTCSIYLMGSPSAMSYCSRSQTIRIEIRIRNEKICWSLSCWPFEPLHCHTSGMLPNY